MTKIIFDKIKKKIIFPYINLERDFYDCGIINRQVNK